MTPEVRALLRHDLSTFIQQTFVELNPGVRYLPNWHIDLMATALTWCLNGTCRRLIINVPPRSMKSISVSVAFPAWWLGHRPSDHVIGVSYAQDLSNKLSDDCRAVMRATWYQECFPTRLSATRNAVNEFRTTQRGTRLATSTGGVLTGRGAELIVIDDPLKPDEALSESLREACNRWFSHTLYSRQNDKGTTTIVIVMQRLHEDDLVGHVTEQDGWTVISLPAIAEEDERHVLGCLGQRYTVTRRAGEVLHPEREPAAVVDELRRTLGDYHFAAQYQQRPAPLGGGLVKREWFATYTPETRPQRFDAIIQAWDTASKANEYNDYSVGTTWGTTSVGADNIIYLLDVQRARYEYPELKRQVKAHIDAFKPDIVLIEDRASGIQLIQELKAEGCSTVKGINPLKEKVARLMAQTPGIEQGRVLLPESAPWLEEYLRELTNFPNGRYDDQVDSTSMALEWINTREFQPGMGYFYYMKRLWREQQERQGLA